MPYSDIPGTKAAYIDSGALTITRRTTQPNILIVGPSGSGTSLRRFNVVETGLAEREFGSASPVMRTVHEALRQGSNNLSVLRAGGHPGRWTATDSDSDTLTVITKRSDDDVLDRYALRITFEDSTPRYVVYDITDRQYVYDSLRLLALDDGDVYIEDTGFAPGALLNDTEPLPQLWTKLTDVVIADFDVSGAGGVTVPADPVSEAGDDGTNPSLVERYAALEQAYFRLDYKDADFLIPVDTYIDALNIIDTADASKTGAPASGTDYGYFWSGPPVAGSDRDLLGYLWRYVYRGVVYSLFTDQTDYFSFAQVAASITHDGVTLACSETGKGGNACTMEFVGGGTAGAETVTIDLNDDGGYDIVVTIEDAVSTQTQASAAINTAIAAATAATVGAHNSWVRLPSDVFGTAGVTVGATAVNITAAANFTSGSGGNKILMTFDPYGTNPTVVDTKITNGADAEIREINFAHQLAEACYLASVNWSTMLGVINFKEPDQDSLSISRSYIPNGNWVGDLPEYSDNDIDVYIGAVADNGEGILGNKFLAGEYGYRGHLLEAETDTSGLAYGGLIRTVGSALPNGEKWPYGISPNDEALDESGRPIDLGKHIFVCYDWPLLSNGYNGGSQYYGTLAATFAGKLAVTPSAEEPIGQQGRLISVGGGLDIHSTQLSQLAQIRAIGMRFDDDSGSWILTTAKNAAHPSSDYRRASTIRVANRLITGARRITAPYIGKQFNPQVLMSLKSALDQYITAEHTAGVHNGGRIAFSYTPQDRILGRLTLQIRFVPPFTLESIVVKTSLAADESDL